MQSGVTVLRSRRGKDLAPTHSKNELGRLETWCWWQPTKAPTLKGPRDKKVPPSTPKMLKGYRGTSLKPPPPRTLQ